MSPHLHGKRARREHAGDPQTNHQGGRRRKGLGGSLLPGQRWQKQQRHRAHLPEEQTRRVEQPRIALETDNVSGKGHGAADRHHIAKIHGRTRFDEKPKPGRGDPCRRQHAAVKPPEHERYDDHIQGGQKRAVGRTRVRQADRLEGITKEQIHGRDGRGG